MAGIGKIVRTLIQASSLSLSVTAFAVDIPLTQYVNPFIGSEQGVGAYEPGNTNPGATYPFGMVNFNGDNVSGHGGYEYGKNSINAFSMTRFSGRFFACYMDFGFMPTTGFTSASASPGTNWSTYSQTMTHGSPNEVATPGFYHVHLDTKNMDVDLTATRRTGFGKFTFPATTNANMLINATHSAGLVSGSANVDSANRMVTGTANAGKCGGTFTYNVYFAAKFDQPFTAYGTWNGATVTGSSTSSGSGTQQGAYVSFNTSTNQVVQVKVGISFVSLANAQANLNAENDPTSFASPHDFNTVKTNTENSWNSMLNQVQVTGGTTDEKSVFYTALYHSLMHPNTWSDTNGQYMAFDGTVQTTTGGKIFYQNFPGWDQHHTHMPLMAILYPSQAADMAYSLADMVTRDTSTSSCIPRWQQAADTTQGMNGDGGTISAANLYAYDVTNDSDALLAAAYRGATDVNAKSHGKVCREGLADWLAQGYVDSTTQSRFSGTISLEYAEADFALAQMARMKGDWPKYYAMMKSSRNWRNLWSSSAVSNGQSGWFLSRTSTGTFNTGDIGCNNTCGFHEGSVEQYLWYVYHDRRGLINQLGGSSNAISRLQAHFGTTRADLVGSYKSFNAFLANEPQILAPSTYAFASDPAKGAEVWRRLLLNWWTNSPDGIPGNDDAGAMSSSIVMAAIGLNHAIPGVPGFVIGSPLFTGVTIRLPGGGTLQINAATASDTNMYVQSMNLNSTAYNSPWLPWSAVKTGATIDFTLGNTPSSTWGKDATLAPPSFGVPDIGFDNKGTSEDNATNTGNFDGGGRSYSSNALAAAGFASEAVVTVQGMQFQWPTNAANAKDNIVASGEVVTLPSGSSGTTLGFLGAANGGPVSGVATVTYTDGSLYTFTLAFSDWTLNGGTSTILASNQFAASMTYRNKGGNLQETKNVYVFYTSTPINSTKTVKSVTLPTAPGLHVFAVATN